ncbi:carcinoembryonic antigen-related cell adhesion molecule 2-like isoform X2 [Xiphophorus hellerii]|uniref:carcinoembryonic antigen-related cell adhesion molecule 2-like isoform X2 n=1 Tax=Xiphophorus hellerii TaxID=8084 RepID=UPI0013B3B2F8|nr:carcinoembryonic antigen-related cell adhesion molecule 2-like isoform X2 [Xiphophorus hellerii]
MVATGNVLDDGKLFLSVRKMASDSVLCVFLLCCSAVASQGCDLYAATGRSINVRLGYTLKSDDSLKWKFKDQTIFFKKSSHIIAGKPSDINVDGSLKLTNLKKDQEGVYTPEVYNNNGKAQKTVTTHLCIRDPVKKPKVNATCQDGNVRFHCFLGQQPTDAKYEWLLNGAKMEESNLSFEIKAAENEAHQFVCKVFNEASSETSEPVANNCAKIDCDQFVAVGGDFIVPLGYQLKPTNTLKWKFNGSIIFYKKTERLVVGKNADINDDGSLKLTNLKKDQAGLYTCEVFDQNGRPQTTRNTNLCVLDPVKKPEVKATCQDENVIFHCVSGAPADAELEWLQDGEEAKGNRRSFETKAKETKGAQFVCKVSNKVSSESSQPVVHICAKTGYPDELVGINIWILTGARVGLIVVLTVLVSVCFVRVEKKMTMGLRADGEELPLQRTDTEQHSHDPHFSPLQPHHLQS